MPRQPKKVLILGGGFAGVAAAKTLSSTNLTETILIDRSAFHIFHASLYEVAAEEVTRETVTIPLQKIFSEDKIKVLKDEIVRADKAKKAVYLKSGRVLGYDFLVLSLGAESSDFGIKGVRENAYIFREFRETMLLRDHIRTVMHLANERDQEVVTILICGGGFSGVELAAELRHHLEHLRGDYPYKKVAIKIIEAGPRILPGFPEKAVRLVEKKLAELKVELLLNSPVAQVKNDGVRLKGGEWVPTDMTIWCAGIRPNSLPEKMGLPLDEKGRPVVNESLAVLGFPEIFVAGDLAGYTDPKTGKGTAPQAHYAVQMGTLVGKNILRIIRGWPLKKLRPDPLEVIVPVGHNYAVASLNGRILAGFFPSFLRKIIEFRYLVSLFGPLHAWPIFWEEAKVMAE